MISFHSFTNMLQQFILVFVVKQIVLGDSFESFGFFRASVVLVLGNEFF